MPSLHIGTSGWQHDPFAGRFYPDNLAQGDRLAFYANTFGTVEVNNTFYQNPDEDTLRAWHRQTPDAFTFAIKANQYITHFKKLKDPVEPVQNLYRNVAPLGDKLGPLLFQCPPNWHQNLDRLHSFLETLDDTHRHVFEFRDPTWLNEGTTRALAAHDAAFCVYDYGDRETLRTVTTNWVYVRLHGAGGGVPGPLLGRRAGGVGPADPRLDGRGARRVFLLQQYRGGGPRPARCATVAGKTGDGINDLSPAFVATPPCEIDPNESVCALTAARPSHHLPRSSSAPWLSSPRTSPIRPAGSSISASSARGRRPGWKARTYIIHKSSGFGERQVLREDYVDGPFRTGNDERPPDGSCELTPKVSREILTFPTSPLIIYIDCK
jgi:uncharacterized protein YecE (DUF72 family)